MTDWGEGFSPVDALAATEGGPQAEVELVGPNLRIRGKVSLGRFGRLSDRLNYSRGFVDVQEVRVLERNGDPTAQAIAELYVSPDDITFVAVVHDGPTDRPSTAGGDGRSMRQRRPRRYIVFTPGHVITGDIHVHGDTSLATFVETADPRFVPMTDVIARSLVDTLVETRLDVALVNRTQMIAVAEADRASAGPYEPTAVTD